MAIHPIPRRMAIALVLGSAAAAVWPQAFPQRPITIVVPFPPGGTTDILARLLAEKLTASLHQTVVVDNRQGAGGNVGSEYVAKAQPDGHTVLLSSAGPLAINQFLYARLGYDPARDFVPVSLLAAVPIMLVAHPARPFQTLPELIAYAKANPGKLSYGSQGNGTTSHLTMELLKQQAGIDILHVPYRGSAPAAAALIGGQIDLMFDNSPSTWPQVQAGKMKALAVATPERVPSMPDIPAVSEQVKGFESTAWFALVAPKGTPDAVSATLNGAIDAALKSPDVRDKLGASGVTLLGGPQATLASYIDGERDKWRAVVRKSGAKVDG